MRQSQKPLTNKVPRSCNEATTVSTVSSPGHCECILQGPVLGGRLLSICSLSQCVVCLLVPIDVEDHSQTQSTHRCTQFSLQNFGCFSCLFQASLRRVDKSEDIWLMRDDASAWLEWRELNRHPFELNRFMGKCLGNFKIGALKRTEEHILSNTKTDER